MFSCKEKIFNKDVKLTPVFSSPLKKCVRKNKQPPHQNPNPGLDLFSVTLI